MRFLFVRLTGGSGDDLLGDGPASALLVGGSGADTLRGGPGDDSLTGDDIPGAAEPDTLDGGPGRDRASWSGTRDAVRVDLRDPSPDGRAGEGEVLAAIEDVQGGRGTNELLGDDGSNELRGGGDRKSQRYEGRGGDDVLASVDRAAELFGGPGDDELLGSLRPRCGTGRDTILQACYARIGDCEVGAFGPFVGLTLRARFVADTCCCASLPCRVAPPQRRRTTPAASPSCFWRPRGTASWAALGPALGATSGRPVALTPAGRRAVGARRSVPARLRIFAPRLVQQLRVVIRR
jgi:hypothetical protein